MASVGACHGVRGDVSVVVEDTDLSLGASRAVGIVHDGADLDATGAYAEARGEVEGQVRTSWTQLHCAAAVES